MVALSEILPVEAVRLDVRAGDWRAAVELAGDLLVATGVSTDGYTTEMLRNIEENGPYVVIAPGFAFAHARPSPAVHRTGMSWVRLAAPVEFGHETNDPVDLVVALAAEDSGAHTAAMASLARLLADEEKATALKEARTPEHVHALLRHGSAAEASPGDAARASGRREDPDAARRTPSSGSDAATGSPAAGTSGSMHKILTVCGNGVGTSLFLKNTLEQVLDRWGWSGHVTVEATDTISAKGKASEAVAILTSQEIARALGEVGVPVQVVNDFTSTTEVDSALRDTYDV